MFDHRREHPFYGICRRTGGELDHTVAKRFLRRSAMPPFDPYWSTSGQCCIWSCPIPAPHHYQTSNVHSADRMPRGSIEQRTAEREIGAAARAIVIEQSEAARFVAKQHEAPVQQFDRRDRPFACDLAQFDLRQRCRRLRELRVTGMLGRKRAPSILR